MRPDPRHGNVLILADNFETGEQLGRLVAATGERASVHVADPRRGLTDPDLEAVDLVITDLCGDLPVSRSLMVGLLAGDLLEAVPRIHLWRDDDDRQEILDAGPDSSVLAMAFPPDPSALQLRVRLAAEIGRLRRSAETAETRDALTGLANRRYLLQRVDEEFARARRHRGVISLLLLDIDGLREINETFGHTTGDSVIQQVAAIVRQQTRREDVAGRLHGATLGVLLIENGCRGAATFANKVRTEAEEIVLQHGGDVHRIHVSAGISTFPDSDAVVSGERLLKASERALREAKNRGGNRVFIDESVLSHPRPVVLVADPDAELLDLAEDLLSVDDLQVIRADSARGVLETLRFRRPDLLVLDLQMTDRAQDPPLVEQIRGLFPSGSFPIIGLTRDTSASAAGMARLGVDRFITKPFSVSLLRSAARELIETPRAASSGD